MVPTGNNSKPYVKLAGTLASLGIGIYFIEQFGLKELKANGALHIDGTLLSILVITPFALIIAAIVVFMVGKMRRL